MSARGPSVKVAAEWLLSEEAEDLGPAALALLLSALAYSATHTTDGVLARRALRKLWLVDDLESAVDTLVSAGELEDRGDVLVVVRWHDFILSRDEVDQIKAGNRERDERRRRCQRGDHSMCKSCRAVRDSQREPRHEPQRDSRDESRVTHGHPTRPAPTRSDPTPREGRERGAEADVPPGAGAPADAATGADDMHACDDPNCQSGYLGVDDDERPIPCLACRPHLRETSRPYVPEVPRRKAGQL